MAGSSKDIIDSLIAKFHAMSDLCKAFENENGILKEQLMHQKQEMQALQSKYEELEKRYGNLKLSKTVAGQDGSSTEETKVRFARLVREIDAMNDDKLKITLRIADLKTPLALRVDYGADEKYWRDAADLFNKRWAFYKDKYKDGLMDSESMMAMVAVEMARLYCEMVQDRKTLLADLRKLEAEAAKILDGHTGE